LYSGLMVAAVSSGLTIWDPSWPTWPFVKRQTVLTTQPRSTSSRSLKRARLPLEALSGLRSSSTRGFQLRYISSFHSNTRVRSANTSALFQITIPSSIPSGSYIMRHEVINLARASTGQAEAFPECFQLQVTGGGSSTPAEFVKSLKSGEVARFPGAYKATDAGLNFDPYTAGKDYPFPGPQIAGAISNGGGGEKSTTPGSTPTHSVPTSTPVGTSTTSTTSLRAPANPGSSPTHAPRVLTTTITEVFVLTLTIPNDSPKNKKLVFSTTTTSLSHHPTTTPAGDPKDGCYDEEEHTPPTTTTTSSTTKPTGRARRHSRRSERWRVAAVGS
jgi:hypothetical protein